MGKLWKPGDSADQNRKEINIGKGPGAKPQMTAKMIGKVMDVVNSHLDTKFNPDGFIDEMRAEYDHRVATAQPMCDPDLRKDCHKTEAGTLFCSWRNYLECVRKTLLWRRQDIEENKDTIGGQASAIEIQAMQHILDLSLDTVEKYLQKEGYSLQKGPER